MALCENCKRREVDFPGMKCKSCLKRINRRNRKCGRDDEGGHGDRHTKRGREMVWS